MQKRDRYQSMFEDIIAAGVEAGVFHVGDIRLTNMAILTMCSTVSDWFSETGRLSGQMIADQYVGLVLRLVGHTSEKPPHYDVHPAKT
jgi:hypothetical protein